MNTETSPLEENVELNKLDLSVEVKETSACERHVKVTIPREDIERYFQKQFDELTPHAEVPGFRAGKAASQIGRIQVPSSNRGPRQRLVVDGQPGSSQ
ncbi:MAG: trigger factor family protein [Pirellulaceae bacterium]